MFCKFCGAKIDSDAIFCESCGKRVKDAPVSASALSASQSVSASAPSSISWLVKQPNGRHLGPVSEKDLILKIKNGLVSSEATIKKDQPNASWISVSESPFASFSASSSIFIPDRWIWCLAILPIFISFILRYFNLLPFDPSYDFIPCVILNSIFFVLDKNLLEDAGIFESWTYIGRVLVPVFLLVREIKTNHNFAPFILNTFLIIMSFIVL